MTNPVSAEELRIVPANHATWQDLEAIFGTADYPFHWRGPRRSRAWTIVSLARAVGTS